jgi:ribonuclease T
MLSVGGVLFHCTRTEYQVLEEFQYYVQRQVYRVTPGALRCNKINVAALPEQPLTPDEISTCISRAIRKHTKGKVKPLAHNWKFDQAFLEEDLGRTFWQHLDYHAVDTVGFLALLEKLGKIPNCKLETGCKFFGIEYDQEQAHGALYDAQRCALLFWECAKRYATAFDNPVMEAK